MAKRVIKITAYDLAIDTESNSQVLIKDREYSYSSETKLDSPEKVAKALYEILNIESMVEERLWCCGLSNTGELLGIFEINHGNCGSSYASVSGIFRRLCIMPLCTCFVLAHNHPSGNPEPSNSDLDYTVKVKEISNCMQDIKLLDHIIIARNGDYYSFNNNKVVL